MTELLKDSRVRRFLIANTTGSIGSGLTIFAVPWLMVQEAGGSQAYRWITIATTLFLFLIMPHYGALVDRKSRKALLLASEAFGFVATTSMALTGLFLGHFALWQLMVTYFCGMLYYTLSYPARFAFIQQIFDRSSYQKLMGLIEVQGQTAQLLSGAAGALLVGHVPLWVILLIDASTYAVSYLIQATLPYEATHVKAEVPGETRPGVLASVTAGWTWLAAHPGLGVFLAASFIPFISIMVSNYLFPIYVSQTLHRTAFFFGVSEVAFGVGAVAAGYALPRFLSKHSAAATIPATMGVFLAGILAVTFLRVSGVYLVVGVLLGFGNAGCRVARNTLMLNSVPNAVMGRVGIFFSVFDRFLRTVLVAGMVVVDRYGPPSGFGLLAAILGIALVAAFRSRHAAIEAERTHGALAA